MKEQLEFEFEDGSGSYHETEEEAKVMEDMLRESNGENPAFTRGREAGLLRAMELVSTLPVGANIMNVVAALYNEIYKKG